MSEFNLKAMQLAAKWAESYAAQFGTHCPADNDPAVARAALQAHLEAAYQAARQSALEEAAKVCEECHPQDLAFLGGKLRALAGEGMKD